MEAIMVQPLPLAVIISLNRTQLAEINPYTSHFKKRTNFSALFLRLFVLS